jgi:hypothetical protein
MVLTVNDGVVYLGQGAFPNMEAFAQSAGSLSKYRK